MRTTSVDLEKRHYQLCQQMVENNDADNQSEALRRAIDAGGEALGYSAGQKRDTTLRAVTRRLADAFALLALMWVGITLWAPVELRVYAAAPFAASVACMGLDRLLSKKEPAISQRLHRIFSQGEKA